MVTLRLGSRGGACAPAAVPPLRALPRILAIRPWPLLTDHTPSQKNPTRLTLDQDQLPSIGIGGALLGPR